MVGSHDFFQNTRVIDIATPFRIDAEGHLTADGDVRRNGRRLNSGITIANLPAGEESLLSADTAATIAAEDAVQSFCELAGR